MIIDQCHVRLQERKDVNSHGRQTAECPCTHPPAGSALSSTNAADGSPGPRDVSSFGKLSSFGIPSDSATAGTSDSMQHPASRPGSSANLPVLQAVSGVSYGRDDSMCVRLGSEGPGAARLQGDLGEEGVEEGGNRREGSGGFQQREGGAETSGGGMPGDGMSGERESGVGGGRGAGKVLQGGGGGGKHGGGGLKQLFGRGKKTKVVCSRVKNKDVQQEEKGRDNLATRSLPRR